MADYQGPKTSANAKQKLCLCLPFFNLQGGMQGQLFVYCRFCQILVFHTDQETGGGTKYERIRSRNRRIFDVNKLTRLIAGQSGIAGIGEEDGGASRRCIFPAREQSGSAAALSFSVPGTGGFLLLRNSGGGKKIEGMGDGIATAIFIGKNHRIATYCSGINSIFRPSDNTSAMLMPNGS
ncbi:MAG: hypothetical protein ACQERN_03955 [Thermodesulfobacteriota bacterium]